MISEGIIRTTISNSKSFEFLDLRLTKLSLKDFNPRKLSTASVVIYLKPNACLTYECEQVSLYPIVNLPVINNKNTDAVVLLSLVLILNSFKALIRFYC